MRRPGKLLRRPPIYDALIVGGVERAHIRLPQVGDAGRVGAPAAAEVGRRFGVAGSTATRQAAYQARTASVMKLPIYLDYSATTPVDPRVAHKMIPYLTEHFGNPASRSHSFGWTTEAAVEEAREHVAALVNCDPKELVWTSGATESINLALKGAAHFYRDKGKHLVTVRTEHKATLDTMRELE